MRVVARAVGYYGTEFTCARGVTQGDPLSPTIFNVVVDSVVQHWVYLMVEGAEYWSSRRQEGRHKNALFYADDGMVAFPDTQWIQGYFSTLVSMFDRVGMWTNFRKKFVMVCRLCQAAGTQLEVAYGRRITVEGPL